jgi:hypothetical protein
MEAYLCSPKFLFRNGRRASSSIQTEWGALVNQCLKTREEGTVSVWQNRQNRQIGKIGKIGKIGQIGKNMQNRQNRQNR